MKHRIAARVQRLASSSAAAGMMLVLCLNLAVLPCAMALGLDDHDCPHCPPADEHAMAGHHQGHGAGQHEAPQPELTSACVTAVAACCDAATPSVDTRASQLKLKGDGNDQPIAAAISPVLLPTGTHTSAASADPPDPPGTPVPRHVLFCVYLD